MSDGIAWARKTLLGDKDLDFMAWQKIQCQRLGANHCGWLDRLGVRGRNFLAIDFNGGTSAHGPTFGSHDR